MWFVIYLSVNDIKGNEKYMYQTYKVNYPYLKYTVILLIRNLVYISENGICGDKTCVENSECYNYECKCKAGFHGDGLSKCAGKYRKCTAGRIVSVNNVQLGTVHLIFWGGGWYILEKNFLALILTKKINLLNGTVKKIICLQ